MPKTFLSIVAGLLFSLTTTLLVAAERNIVFFVTDDQSPTLGCYGDKVASSPRVDELARDGTLFRNAFAVTASCSPSRSTILSGLYPHTNGMYGLMHAEHHFSSLDEIRPVTLPVALAAAGYRTAQAGKLHVGPEAAYHFQHYLAKPTRNTVKLVEECESFLTADPDVPFFLYIGTPDPHRDGRFVQDSPAPFKPNSFGNPEPGKSYPGVSEIEFDPETIPVPEFLNDTPVVRAELAQYYQSCARVDQGFGRLVDLLKKHNLYDKTLIVFTSDHGIAMPGAKTTTYETGLRVPFIVRDPYQKKRGVVSEAMISHIDIVPSLLDFAGKSSPSTPLPPKKFRYPGRSWIQILGEENPKGWDRVYASHTFHEVQMYYPMRVIRDRDFKFTWNIAHQLPFPFASDLWKSATWQEQLTKPADAPFGKRTAHQYQYRPQFELYDLRNDPDELNNLADHPDHAEKLQAYIQEMKEFQTRTADPWRSKWTYE
jgi:N-sulfoglucosamine sulfohydrolase